MDVIVKFARSGKIKHIFIVHILHTVQYTLRNDHLHNYYSVLHGVAETSEVHSRQDYVLAVCFLTDNL
jgi:hypothetical protein